MLDLQGGVTGQALVSPFLVTSGYGPRLPPMGRKKRADGLSVVPGKRRLGMSRVHCGTKDVGNCKRLGAPCTRRIYHTPLSREIERVPGITEKPTRIDIRQPGFPCCNFVASANNTHI